MEKVKEIRQNFAKAVVAGNRNGSTDDLLEESSADDDSNVSNYDKIDREILLAEENEKENNDQEDDFEKEGMKESTSTSEVVQVSEQGTVYLS
ncbi:Hypothetical predicted protein [Paramuricea clavata]|uniref:Uncharacterized protein n=1 Tax=Paramuricea clavata TaxID=317549 RepID=A0A6S7GFB5_PARCT|nr:Hypothetical predicted protein [Paramuricea clavata]